MMRERAVAPSRAAPNAPVAPIKAPAMNITLGSVGTISLAAVLTAWKGAIDYLFGTTLDPQTRARLLMVTVLAIVVVVSVDMLARAIASRGQRSEAAPVADGWSASVSGPGLDAKAFTVVAVRSNPASVGGMDLLLWKAGAGSAWHRSEDVAVEPPS